MATLCLLKESRQKNNQECHLPETSKNYLILKFKQLLMSPLVLGYPNLNLPFVVYMDESLAAVLVQQIEEVLAYARRTLNQEERNYTTTEQECLAVWGS